MYPDPLWLCVTYLYGRIRQRTRTALDGNPESGALSLEWIVIATLLTIAAVAVGLFLTGLITTWEGQVKTGP
jgi:Flp pilus assembly pilin Flp